MRWVRRHSPENAVPLAQFEQPEHMALRKPAAQWIQEMAGEEESCILYRAEGYGTHYSSYVCNLTDAQIPKLDKALEILRMKVFGGGRIDDRLLIQEGESNEYVHE